LITNETIPTLEEVLALVEKSGKEINLELKAGSACIPALKNGPERGRSVRSSNKVLISSFDHFAVAKTKEMDAGIQTGALTASRMYFRQNI
jgi:glycerophosphoryl diester phosphodiesterase